MGWWLPEAGMGICCLMGRGLAAGMIQMFWNQTEVVSAQPRECIKCPRIVHIKTISFTFCKFT